MVALAGMGCCFHLAQKRLHSQERLQAVAKNLQSEFHPDRLANGPQKFWRKKPFYALQLLSLKWTPSAQDAEYEYEVDFKA